MPFSAIYRWHRRWFIPIEIGLLLLIAAAWWITSRSPMARLRASGAPMTFAELVSEPIPDEENLAAAVYQTSIWFDSFENALAAFYETAGTVYDQYGSLEPLPEEAIAGAKQLLSNHPEAVEAITEIAKRTRYASLLRPQEMRSGEWIEHGGGNAVRSIARLLNLQQRVQLDGGMVTPAAKTAMLTLRLGKALEAEPFLTNRLIACAVQGIGLQQAERLITREAINSRLAREIDQSLSEVENRSSLRFALNSERINALHSLSKMPFSIQVFMRSEWLRGYERVADLVDLPTAKMRDALAGSTSPADQAWLGVCDAELRMIAKARCLRVALALSQHGGPAMTERLKLPAATLIDPFTEQPLLVEPTESPAGWRVVSAGPDQLLGEDADPTENADNIAIEFSADR